MENIDLHMHSLNSDGSNSTSELLSLLSESGADLFSFTDHDSMGCYYDLDNVDYSGRRMEYVQGVELSFAHNGQLRHMMGYGIDLDEMQSFLEIYHSRELSIRKQNVILESFKSRCAGLGLKFDNNLVCDTGNIAEGYLLMHRSLNEHEVNLQKYPFISDTTRFYWDYFSNRKTPFYVDETVGLPDISQAVDAIHRSGGLAFLAHPLAYGLDENGLDEQMDMCVAAGVDGLEAHHSSNRDGDAAMLRKAADDRGMYVSGGSDFHGRTKPDLHLIHGYGNMKVESGHIEEWIHRVKLFTIG